MTISIRSMPAIRTTAFAGIIAAAGCGSTEQSPTDTMEGSKLIAETFIDAFYSFDPDQLGPLLENAGDASQRLLYYQGWAEGGNYKVVERKPCTGDTPELLTCPVTVQDDPVLALKTGFNVTDTFAITISNNTITNVETSSNDQPIYYEARKWVEKEMPEVMEGPCKDFFAGGNTPGDCARAMTEGYRQFMLHKSASESASFIPPEFLPPTLIEAKGFKLVPLGPDLVDIDYQAYMSSIEHLQKTFTRSTSWPTEDIDAEAAMLDMQTEQQRFENRESFAYAVLTPDGARERGCVYVYPSNKPGYDAVIRLWVTKAEFDAGFDAELYSWAQEWVKTSWPFENPAFPGRSIQWEKWDALPTGSAT